MSSFKRTQRKYVQNVHRVRNWRQYETGLRARGSLTVWLGLTDGDLAHWDAPRPTDRKPGRQRKYSNHAIETAVTLGMVFGLASRQTEGFVRSLLALFAYGTSSPGCNGPLAISVSSWPQAGNTAFSLTCNNASPERLGVLLLGASALSTPFPFLGVDVWVDPTGLFFLALPSASNQVGAGDVVLPLPPGSDGFQFRTQFMWFGPSSPAPCPPSGFSASNALDITIQP